MNLTKITLHGNLGKEVGKKDWELQVESIPEAMHAINVMTNKKFFKTIIDNDKQNVKYRVLVNGKSAVSKSIDRIEDAPESEIFIKRKMETLDIVPVLEGAGGGDDEGKDWALILGGALTMGIGFGMSGAFGPTLIQLGLFAVITGLSNLLAEPPEFEDFREIDAVNKRESYLFNGAVNTYNPGGPVPMGYGRLLIGSATVGFAQENEDKLILEIDADGNETWYP